uniref:Craniofacial development protein 2-like n=1 Tax=Nicotiana tabacum TaxID=4097 RepID=A0A1S3YM28_TOBAC|nr:PREDICTED: uncharacterized protein LOC107777724 [Nicotiana tabacum]
MTKILQKRRVNIACVEETRWVGSKARNADGYKLLFSEVVKGKNKMGILVDKELRESVIKVRRVNDRLMEALDEVVRGIPSTEKLFVGGNFNGHIGSSDGGYGEVHGGFDFGVRNGDGTSLLDFVRAFELVIVNSIFSKREEHLVTFRVW